MICIDTTSMFIELKWLQNMRPQRGRTFAKPYCYKHAMPSALTQNIFNLQFSKLDSLFRILQKRIPKGFNVCRNEMARIYATPKGSNVRNASMLQTCDAFGIDAAKFVICNSQGMIHDSEENAKKNPEGIQCL